MTSLRFIVALGLLLTVRPLRAEEPKAPSKPQEDAYRRPELVAIAWQETKKPGSDDSNMPVWRPDGSLIEKDEVEWLRDDLTNFNCHWWEPIFELRPLVLVFRIDERAKREQMLFGRVGDGQKWRSIGVAQPSGRAHSSTAHHLAKTAIVPSRLDLASWPAAIDIEVRVLVGEPKITQSFDRLPPGELKIAEGIRWYIDPAKGQRRENGRIQSGLPAAVLEFDSKLADPLLTVWQEIRLKDGELLRTDYASLPDGDGLGLHVSRPVEESNPIVGGKFTLIHHRIERYEKLSTRLDLKPKDE